MEAIIVTLISGFFSLATIWQQNYLQKNQILTNQSGSVKNKLTSQSKSPALRIILLW